MRVFALLLASVATVSAARADPAADRAAREHNDRGKQLVDRRAFADAFDEFSAGYDASGRPQFLFNMAECQRALGKPHARESSTSGSSRQVLTTRWR